jgi:hypothetical protein
MCRGLNMIENRSRAYIACEDTTVSVGGLAHNRTGSKAWVRARGRQHQGHTYRRRARMPRSPGKARWTQRIIDAKVAGQTRDSEETIWKGCDRLRQERRLDRKTGTNRRRGSDWWRMRIVNCVRC